VWNGGALVLGTENSEPWRSEDADRRVEIIATVDIIVPIITHFVIMAVAIDTTIRPLAIARLLAIGPLLAPFGLPLVG